MQNKREVVFFTTADIEFTSNVTRSVVHAIRDRLPPTANEAEGRKYVASMVRAMICHLVSSDSAQTGLSPRDIFAVCLGYLERAARGNMVKDASSPGDPDRSLN